MLTGGESGTAIKPGHGGESLLLKAAAHESKPHMPPAKNKVDARQLTSRELGLLKLWIDEGAKGPQTTALQAPQWQKPPERWDAIYAVSATADGQFVACGRAGRIYIYHVPTRQLVHQAIDDQVHKQHETAPVDAAHLDAVQSLAFSADGHWLASGGFQTIKLWERVDEQQSVQIQLPRPIKDARGMAVSPDGKCLAVAWDDHVIRLFDLAQGNMLGEMPGHGGDVNALAFSKDSARLVTASADKTIRFWLVAERKELRVIQTPHVLWATAWVDDHRVAVAAEDNVIRVWDFNADDKQTPAELKGSGGKVLWMTPLDDNQLLLSSGDEVSALWDVNGTKMTREFNHRGDKSVRPWRVRRVNILSQWVRIKRPLLEIRRQAYTADETDAPALDAKNEALGIDPIPAERIAVSGKTRSGFGEVAAGRS